MNANTVMATIAIWHRRASAARRLAATLPEPDRDVLRAYAAECDFRVDCLSLPDERRCAACPLAGEPCRPRPA